MTSPRRSIEVPGLTHAGIPIPAASRIGPFVATGGVRGVDRTTGEMPADLDGQVRLMFDNLKTIFEVAGTGVDAILKVTIWATTPDARAAINEAWMELFPDPQSRPARHLLTYALPGGMLVQCEALGIVTDQ